jgi:hypothetical protein
VVVLLVLERPAEPRLVQLPSLDGGSATSSTMDADEAFARQLQAAYDREAAAALAGQPCLVSDVTCMDDEEEDEDDEEGIQDDALGESDAIDTDDHKDEEDIRIHDDGLGDRDGDERWSSCKRARSRPACTGLASEDAAVRMQLGARLVVGGALQLL